MPCLRSRRGTRCLRSCPKDERIDFHLSLTINFALSLRMNYSQVPSMDESSPDFEKPLLEGIPSSEHDSNEYRSDSRPQSPQVHLIISVTFFFLSILFFGSTLVLRNSPNERLCINELALYCELILSSLTTHLLTDLKPHCSMQSNTQRPPLTTLSTSHQNIVARRQRSWKLNGTNFGTVGPPRRTA
jgi:hypothetical protein